MYLISAVYRHSDGTVEKTQINSNNEPYESMDFDEPMTFKTAEQARIWVKTDAAKEWDLGFGGHFEIWKEAGQKTIKELEDITGVSLKSALTNFMESCFCQEITSKDYIISVFMEENELSDSEIETVKITYDRIILEAVTEEQYEKRCTLALLSPPFFICFLPIILVVLCILTCVLSDCLGCWFCNLCFSKFMLFWIFSIPITGPISILLPIPLANRVNKEYGKKTDNFTIGAIIASAIGCAISNSKAMKNNVKSLINQNGKTEI